MKSTPAKPGRPRDPQADQSILAAARDLMAEGGLAGLTVEGTATRAGVAKTTVYRRYPTKIDLAIAAVAELINTSPEPDSEDDAEDALGQFAQSLGSSAAQSAMLAVAAAAAMDPDVHERFSAFVLQPALDQTAQALAPRVAAGEVSADLDSNFYYDVIVGTLLHRLVIRRDAVDPAFHDNLERLMEFMHAGLRSP